MKKTILFVAAVVLLMSVGNTAFARIDREMTYRASMVWNSAVRFVRVDQRYEVVERDKEAGYLLFKFEDNGRKYHASLELIPIEKNNKRLLKLSLRIEGMPRYIEMMLLDRFEKKLREEYGSPPKAELVVQPSNVIESVKNSGSDNKGAAGAGGKAGDEEDLEVDQQDLDDSVEGD